MKQQQRKPQQKTLFDMTSPKTHSSARSRVLARLQQGAALNTHLNKICYRYGARIKELRDAGYQIRTAFVGEGVYSYTLTL